MKLTTVIIFVNSIVIALPDLNNPVAESNDSLNTDLPFLLWKKLLTRSNQNSTNSNQQDRISELKEALESERSRSKKIMEVRKFLSSYNSCLEILGSGDQSLLECRLIMDLGKSTKNGFKKCRDPFCENLQCAYNCVKKLSGIDENVILANNEFENSLVPCSVLALEDSKICTDQCSYGSSSKNSKCIDECGALIGDELEACISGLSGNKEIYVEAERCLPTCIGQENLKGLYQCDFSCKKPLLDAIKNKSSLPIPQVSSPSNVTVSEVSLLTDKAKATGLSKESSFALRNTNGSMSFFLSSGLFGFSFLIFN